MPEKYFELRLEEQAILLHDLVPILGRRAEILEKDIWLCYILDTLFKLPNRKPMAFKGGTSLSKVYHAIERFSEDIDVTIDYQSLLPNSPELNSLSNSQREKLSDRLKFALSEYISGEVVPTLRREFTTVLPNDSVIFDLSEDCEKLRIFYPSAVGNTDDYLKPNILIEFGGRNTTLPHEIVEIHPDAAIHVPALDFPKAYVSVLSPLRTFWEKATLIHVECHRSKLRDSAERLSRHWYDLARLAEHEIGTKALANRELLQDVLRIKNTFFRSSYSHYDLCLSGGFRLIPPSALLQALKEDYQSMIKAKMFYGDVLSFEEIVERLKELETRINNWN